MDKKFVYTYLESHKKEFFPNKKYSDEQIEKLMISSSDIAANYMNGLSLCSPTFAVVISIFLGQVGADRFYIGDFKSGILKLITYGGFGIWWLFDIIKIKNYCCERNCEKLIEVLEKYPGDFNGDSATAYSNSFSEVNDDISDILDNDSKYNNRPVITAEEADDCLSSILEDDYINE